MLIAAFLRPPALSCCNCRQPLGEGGLELEERERALVDMKEEEAIGQGILALQEARLLPVGVACFLTLCLSCALAPLFLGLEHQCHHPLGAPGLTVAGAVVWLASGVTSAVGCRL